MISTWMLYVVATSSLIGLCALALEGVALGLGRPARWLWTGALLLSLLPLVFAALPVAIPGSGGASLDLGAAQVIAAAPSPLPGDLGRLRFERFLLAGWLLGSATLLAALLLAAVRLGRERRRWRYGRMAGRAVLVSEDTGPAVAGFLRPEIVVPRWALEYDDEAQRLLLAHEHEHLRAGDSRLLLGAAISLVLMPWNPALWWQAHRLRCAIELDCDARVLRARPRPRAYALLLLDVSRRGPRARLAAAALGEPCSLLERRIRLLAAPGRPGLRATTALCLAGVAGLVVACEVPRPEGPDLNRLLPTAPPAASTLAAAADTIPWSPTPTPYTDKPELVNREEFGQALESAYPPMLRAAGIGGTVLVWLSIGEDGVVREVRVSRSSGRPELDRAAREALRQARFTPARNEGRVVPVWIQLPVIFKVRQGGLP